MVKKAFFIFIPFILIMIGIIISNAINGKAIFASNEVNYLYRNGEDYNIFYLNLENVDINTKNIKDYFGESNDIISITPYINPIYRSKISSLKYNFKTASLESNINSFLSYYEKQIKDSGFIQDIESIYHQGIKINQICLYEKNIVIYRLLKGNPKIKYKNNHSGMYYGI